ncbi:GNAT family N-acetyltransferase [Geomicrobium sp. JCM 19055]|uniref:GNAT family N-acetyltransferase n=1 Tax=Geomicrobium sp. JCM 19055 TaxID=1460649 RepID=UPI00045ECE1D|nr:GNAT family N-acetyltransferase [Geomicrobium sp. JCM 19055]GAK00178.1 acetyltransferase, GNAT family [Geomicrobium sp. JCM 19055]
MNSLVQVLREQDIYVLISDEQIMLEVFRGVPKEISKVDHLIVELLSTAHTYGYKRVTLECTNQLLNQLNKTREKMSIVGERVLYTCQMTNEIAINKAHYEVWLHFDDRSIMLLATIMDIDKDKSIQFLQSMKVELPSQYHAMFTVYIDDGIPVGIVLPHIEPNTDQEGRMFWIGVHPNYKGIGYGALLHKVGLHRLQNDFHAKTYVGITTIKTNQ